MKAFSRLKEIWRGKDLYRILMNEECSNYELKGNVLDLGSGKNQASYHRFFKKSEILKISSLDCGFGEESEKFIDLEKTQVPFKEGEIDIVLAFNLLEHIYNYNFLISEIRRVLKDGGKVFGATPFLVSYHPDPHDYWRYTGESLRKIFSAAGFKNINIKIIGRGPFSASFLQKEFLIPRICKIVYFPVVLALDWLFLKLRPKTTREKFALGYFIILEK